MRKSSRNRENKAPAQLSVSVITNSSVSQINWLTSVEGTKVTFSYLSKDGEEGYPGDLLTNLSYDVTDDDTLLMTFTASSSKRTVVNLTNHSYFNLAGHDAGSDALYDHVITINADK